MYKVRSVQIHDYVIAECPTLVDAICVKTLQSMRYGYECAIFDQDDYLVDYKTQCAALEEVYNRCHQRHPLAGAI